MREAPSTFFILMISHKALCDLLPSPHITGMLKMPTNIRRPIFDPHEPGQPLSPVPRVFLDYIERCSPVVPDMQAVEVP